MDAMLNIETEDVYEAPMLAKAGDFAGLTQGEGDAIPEPLGGQYED